MPSRSITFPLYFNHVPKCGGTTLNEVLSRGLSRTQVGVEPFLSLTQIYTMPRAALERLLLLGSHFPHWAAARRIPDWSTLTVLREPWARFQALSRHLLRIASDEPRALSSAQTAYVGMLRESRFVDALQQSMQWYPWHASMASYLLPDPPEPAAPLDPSGAMRTLERYDVVLLAEHLDADSVLVDQAANGQPFGARARLNTSREYGDVDAGPFPHDLRERFDAQFPYERELYAIACRCREASVAALRAAAHRPAERVGRPQSPYILDWDGPTRCGGFSDRLRASSYGYEGCFARRVEARKAVLEFDVEEVCDARLEAVFWIGPADARFDCRVQLNGRPVKLFDPVRDVACPMDENQLWASADLSAAMLADGHCVLEIERAGAPIPEFWILDLAVCRAGQSRAPAR